MIKFDMHVATENNDVPELEQELMQLGLKPDGLVDRHVDFHGKVMVSACPLIGLHLTKKYDHLSSKEALLMIGSDMKAVESLLRAYNAVGYAHAEAAHSNCDVTIKSNADFVNVEPWPVAPFKPCFSDKNKKWDIHIAIPLDCLPDELADVLTQSGMYSIDLAKVRDGQRKIFRIFTIQGVSSPTEGKMLFDSLSSWFSLVGAPHVEIKCETYVDMVRVGEPMIVPPTIDRVDFLTTKAPVINHFAVSGLLIA